MRSSGKVHDACRKEEEEKEVGYFEVIAKKENVMLALHTRKK